MIKLFEQTFQVKPNVEVLRYGRVENMIIKGNILGLDQNDYNYELIDSKETPPFYLELSYSGDDLIYSKLEENYNFEGENI